MDDDDDRHEQMALCRYQAISAYLALEPSRGQRRPLLEQLAAKSWPGPDGEPLRVSAETLRSWVRRYRKGGLPALLDKPRPQRGVQVLTPEQIETVVALKREVPERSLDRIMRIAEEMGVLERGVLTRSTLHRVLQRAGISARPASASSTKDLDRFEALAPNDLWQSDMRMGPWLADPERPGKARQTRLYSFLDDHSRKLLHGRFSFAGDLPALELVMRRCLQKYGKPKRVYYDNGKTYRSGHMRHIVATLGIHAIVFTQAYRPEGHGKIEAFKDRSSESGAANVCDIEAAFEANEVAANREHPEGESRLLTAIVGRVRESSIGEDEGWIEPEGCSGSWLKFTTRAPLADLQPARRIVATCERGIRMPRGVIWERCEMRE